MADQPPTLEIRAAALHAAEEAFNRVLVERGVHLDFPGRMEAMEQAIEEAADALLAGLQPEPVQ